MEGDGREKRRASLAGAGPLLLIHQRICGEIRAEQWAVGTLTHVDTPQNKIHLPSACRSSCKHTPPPSPSHVSDGLVPGYLCEGR